MRIVVIGATGRTGQRVVTQLCERGHAVAAVGHTAAKLATLDRRAEPHVADLSRPDDGGLARLLAPAEVVVSCAHARYTDALLSATAPDGPRLVLMGSVRRYLRIPDRDGSEIAAAEAALLAAGRRGVMLHASMIYGAPDDGNISRVLGLLARWPRGLPMPLPLPDGGRRLVQPIHVDDVARAVAAAVERPDVDGPPLVLAGPAPLPYRAMVAACAAALGRRILVLPVPVTALARVAGACERLGLRLPLNAAELRRAGEDKNFDAGPMIARLGVRPIAFADGLARMVLPER